MKLPLTHMQEEDTAKTAALIASAMNEAEGRYAEETFRFHFHAKRSGLDDGRQYMLYCDDADIRGISGLHRYIWGPPENVWLGFFALHPSLHGKGYGRALMDATKETAATQGFQRLFIETYESDEFARARRFYTHAGFHESGRIDGYLSDGTAMIVYATALSNA